MSSANRVAIRRVAEVTLGTTPATPALITTRYNGESLNYNIQNTQSSEINSSGVEVDLVQVSADSAGDLSFELTYGSYDDMLESMFRAVWTANNLDVGTTIKGFTIQKHFQDMAIPQFHNYKGVVVDGLSLRMEVGKIVEGSFNLMGMGATVSTAQIAGATFPAASTTKPMNAVANLQNFNIGGVPYTGCISSIGLNMKGNNRQRRCVGSLAPTDVKVGRMAVTGSMEFYFNEGSNYSNFIAGTEFAVSWDLVDANNNKYTFTIPRAKFETGQVVAGGIDTDVMFSATWRALLDSVTGRVIRLTRTPGP